MVCASGHCTVSLIEVPFPLRSTLAALGVLAVGVGLACQPSSGVLPRSKRKEVQTTSNDGTRWYALSATHVVSVSPAERIPCGTVNGRVGDGSDPAVEVKLYDAGLPVDSWIVVNPRDGFSFPSEYTIASGDRPAALTKECSVFLADGDGETELAKGLSAYVGWDVAEVGYDRFSSVWLAIVEALTSGTVGSDLASDGVDSFVKVYPVDGTPIQAARLRHGANNMNDITAIVSVDDEQTWFTVYSELRAQKSPVVADVPEPVVRDDLPLKVVMAARIFAMFGYDGLEQYFIVSGTDEETGHPVLLTYAPRQQQYNLVQTKELIRWVASVHLYAEGRFQPALVVGLDKTAHALPAIPTVARLTDGDKLDWTNALATWGAPRDGAQRLCAARAGRERRLGVA